MKLQINGFDIEINTEDENLTVSVIDANGKELSNNVYQQSSTEDIEGDVQDTEVEEVEGVDTESADDNQAVEETETEDEENENEETETEETVESLKIDFNNFF